VTALEERLVTFEVSGEAYAVPIRDVVEVAEVAPLSCIPTLPEDLGGVMNHHGEALPVLSAQALFGPGAAVRRVEQAQLLVLGGARGQSAGQLGVPVERILGLTRAGEGLAGSEVTLLDAARLLARAARVIAAGGPDNQSLEGGEES
jgi:chemotaxis signal transduction protein